MPQNGPRLSLRMIREADERIGALINRTPVLTSATLDASSGAELFFKCENLQKTGSFKARGATNAIFSLTDAQIARGVVTHSSGNHGAAVARAALLRKKRAYVVMPRTAPKVKQTAVRRYEGTIVFCEPTQAAREEAAHQLLSETGGTLIHAYDDVCIMAGQGTAALELLKDVPNLDVILCPVGGGGLLSGIAVAAKNMRPEIQIVGVEPAGVSDAYQSFRTGSLIRGVQGSSIADGLLTSLCERTFAELRSHVSDMVTVSEEAIIQAMRSIWEIMKLVVEPSGAVSYAALVEARLDVRGKRVGVILSGGNLDLDELPWQ